MSSGCARGKPRTLLVSMPFVSIDRPSLGLSLLQACLRRDGVSCHTRYLTFDLASFIGLHNYLWVSDELPYTAFVGDWVFAGLVDGVRVEERQRYVQEILVETWRLGEDDLARLRRIEAFCEPFLLHCVESVPWTDYAIVGFTSTFTQNLASLALASRVKKRHPQVTIVFGGANWEGEMGVALHEEYPFVDYVCSGESDETFPALLRGLSERSFDASSLPGIVYREETKSVFTGPQPVVTGLDDQPPLDYDDYFRDLEACAAASEVSPTLLLETSRGCWWGAKAHCTFCGLNGGTMVFRSKSAERVLDEIDRLQDRYGCIDLEVVDNILDMSYFKTLLPALTAREQELSLFYETKANLRRAQVQQLAEAGVARIQPGIESLSDHVLELMRKGTTALQNIQLLKWCKEIGVIVDWNVLYGFPGETEADYAEMTRLMDAVWFLDPPGAWGPIRLDRFSPYHRTPEAFGMVGVRAARPYEHLYPFDAAQLARLAYYFDFEYADGRRPDAYVGRLLERLAGWQSTPDRGVLRALEHEDGLILEDLRANFPRRRLRLSAWQAAVYRACDQVRSRRQLVAAGFEHGGSKGEVERFLSLACKLAGWCRRAIATSLWRSTIRLC